VNESASLGPGAARVLYCHCAYAQTVSPGVKEHVLEGLIATGVAFHAVPDLCALAARRDPLLRELAQSGPLQIVACFPRAVRALFAAAGAELPTDGVEFVNMRTMTAVTAPANVLPRETLSPPSEAAASSEVVASLRAAAQAGPPNRWKPWFPVIDAARCQNCGQCLSFCLFGVYGRSPEGRVEVQKPQNCKPDCPACARVCPEVAIMFPKYPGAPINGDEVRAADLQREASSAGGPLQLGDNLMQALRDRTVQAKARFSKDRDDSLAQQERQRCLEKHQAAAGHPAPPPSADGTDEASPPRPAHGQ